MFNVKPIHTLAILGVVLLQAGCATSKFACPAKQGVPCMSVSEVYERTEFSSSIELESAHGPVANSAGQLVPHAPAAASTLTSTVHVEEGSLVLDESTTGPAPVTDALLTGARVIRVWVAPWEDRRGDLHLPGYVFAEVQGRRWRVGNTAPLSRPVLRLLDATSSGAAVASPEAPSTPN